MGIEIPDVIGLRQIGRDALGLLCVGSRSGDGREVRVRFLARNLSDDELGQLAAPGLAAPPDEAVAAIIGVGRDESARAYVVIDAGSDATLADRRARGECLSPSEAVDLVTVTSRALDALHGRGEVYGTITPDSILATPTGWRLVDSGLAAVTIPLPPPREAPIDGVLAYTAPEVLAGAPCSPAADVFSLAATALELLHGVRVPEHLRRRLEAALATSPGARPDAASLRDSAAGAAPQAGVGAGATPAASPSPQSDVLDEDVQFTVYRPHSVQPGRWYTLLAFAHKSEPFVDELLGPVDPVEEVRRQASMRLGEDLGRYGSASDDSSQQLPRGSSLTFVPEVDGVEFNPPRRSFMWLEPVHQEDFRMRAEARLEGQRARGRLSVYFGSILIAEVSLAFRVSSSEPDAAAGREDSRPYRKIFISYSHHDRAVVEQVETFLSVVGDQFLRDSAICAPARCGRGAWPR